MINADSWAFYASGAYFQQANSLSEPGRTINDCGIYSAANFTNFSYSSLEYAPEGILLPSIDRDDGTYNASVPPDPAPENTPLDDPPTPALPYNATSLSPGLATAFNATAYFATYTPAPVSSSSSLPPTPITTTSSASPPAGSACVGNQIEGSCTMASPPSSTPDSGPAQPVCNKVDSAPLPYLMFNATQAAQGAADYCANLISGGVVLSSSTSNPNPGRVDNGAEKGGFISYVVMFDVDSCDPGTAAENQKLDFKALGQDGCYQYLYTQLAQFCKLSCILILAI